MWFYKIRVSMIAYAPAFSLTEILSNYSSKEKKKEKSMGKLKQRGNKLKGKKTWKKERTWSCAKKAE